MTTDISELTINVLYQKDPDFFHGVTAFNEVPLTSSPCFPSITITKNAETHPPLMRDIIIEQPLGSEREL